MNPYSPVNNINVKWKLSPLRSILGWVFFLGIGVPYLIVIVIYDLVDVFAKHFHCFCESTIQYIWENEPWLETYKRNSRWWE